MTLDTKGCLRALKSLQLTRSDIMFWIMLHGHQEEAQRPNLRKKVTLEDLRRRGVRAYTSDFEGLLVRVLVQVEDGEEYRICRITGVELTEAYSGFSFDNAHQTRLLLRVVDDEVSQDSKRSRRRAVVDRDALYQLTAVSNKEFQLDEVKKWRRTNQEFYKRILLGKQDTPRNLDETPEGTDPLSALSKYTFDDLTNKVSTIKRQEMMPSMEVDDAQPIDTSLIPRISIETPKSTDRCESVDNTRQEVIISQTKKLSVSHGLDERQIEELERDVEEEESRKHFPIPLDYSTVSLTKCRELEKGILEYLDTIKQTLAQFTSQCVVCMAGDATVLILPCKHKVLCLACGTKVHQCPMCRVAIREVLQPVQL